MMMNIRAITLGAIALTMAPLTPAGAQSPHRGEGRGYHHFGLGGAVVSAIIGVLTLPLVIAAAAIDPPQYEPPYRPPPAYYRPPVNYYASPVRYYAGPDHYAARPRHDGYRAYRSVPRRGDYPYRR